MFCLTLILTNKLFNDRIFNFFKFLCILQFNLTLHGHPHTRRQIQICLQKTYTHQPLCRLQFLYPLFLQRQCHQIPYKTSSHPMLPQHLQKELDTVYTTSLQNGHPLTESNASWTVSKTKTREP